MDEQVRRDRLGVFWSRWGILITVLVVGLLAGLAGWLWWQDRQAKAAGADGEVLVQVIDKIGVGDNAGARPLLEGLAKNGVGAYPALARLMQAADQVAVGEEDKAAALLEAVIADGAVSQPLRDAALVKLVRLRFDTLAPADIVNRLKPLAVPGNPWFGLAGEMSAMAHLKAGTPDQATPLLTAIVKDETLPSTLRNRAAQMALALGVEESALGMNEQAAADLPAAAQQPAPAPAPAPEGAN
ncbi:tetratricopeptide repeat protein [Polymorphobacter sp.]|uniref:tetratricopeptide repeat protein n=1 Tax=Polymorphobacter sp. TaxID=1909290 RepID=UPI003F703E65